jgi:hypothetical protein
MTVTDLAFLIRPVSCRRLRVDQYPYRLSFTIVNRSCGHVTSCCLSVSEFQAGVTSLHNKFGEPWNVVGCCTVNPTDRRLYRKRQIGSSSDDYEG